MAMILGQCGKNVKLFCFGLNIKFDFIWHSRAFFTHDDLWSRPFTVEWNTDITSVNFHDDGVCANPHKLLNITHNIQFVYMHVVF